MHLPLGHDASDMAPAEVNLAAFARLDVSVIAVPACQFFTVGEMLPNALHRPVEEALEAHGEDAKGLSLIAHGGVSFFSRNSRVSSLLSQKWRIRVTHSTNSSTPSCSSS